MRDWKDLNGDGEIDNMEDLFAEEMMCTSREEHIALFGNAGDFDEDDYEDEDDDDFDDDYDDDYDDDDWDEDSYDDEDYGDDCDF